MAETSLKKTVITSLIWKFMEVCGTSGISLIVGIIVARLLVPEDYGLIAIVTVLISLSGTIISGGFNTALIQKKDVSDTDYSSVFYLTLGFATLIYGIIFIGAPYLAGFYNQPLITPVFRVLGLTVFTGTVNSIQVAVLSRNFLFKKMFFNNLILVLISGVVGIGMAYFGFGVWALVGQSLVSSIGLCILMWFTVKWRPHLLFSWSRLKELFSFGWKIMVSNLLYQGYQNVSSLLIGKVYSQVDLGNYSKGREIPNYLTNSVNSTIQSVMFPAFSQNQHNPNAVKSILHRAIVTSGFLVFPAMIGLMVISEPLVELLLTDKWLGAVPFMQIFSIGCLLYPVHITNSTAINAMGRSDLTLKAETTKWAVALILICITGFFGAITIALGLVMVVIFATYLLTSINKRLISYGWKEQWKDMIPSLLLALIMGLLIYPLQFLSLPLIVILIIQILCGVLIYFGLALFLKLEAFIYLRKTLKEMI